MRNRYVNAPVISESLDLTPIPGWELEFEINDCGFVPWNKGLTGVYRTSDETKEKIRQSRLGKKLSEETKAKISRNNSKPRKPYPPREKWSEERRAMGQGKTYTITHPDGKIEIVTNLSRFCEAHGICRVSLNRVASGRAEQHKGFKAVRV